MSALPGLGGIELNESVVREHPYRDDAVQSMWMVNGAMLPPETAEGAEVVNASPVIRGPQAPTSEEENAYENARKT